MEWVLIVILLIVFIFFLSAAIAGISKRVKGEIPKNSDKLKIKQKPVKQTSDYNRDLPSLIEPVFDFIKKLNPETQCIKENFNSTFDSEHVSGVDIWKNCIDLHKQNFTQPRFGRILPAIYSLSRYYECYFILAIESRKEHGKDVKYVNSFFKEWDKRFDYIDSICQMNFEKSQLVPDILDNLIKDLYHIQTIHNSSKIQEIIIKTEERIELTKYPTNVKEIINESLSFVVNNKSNNETISDTDVFSFLQKCSPEREWSLQEFNSTDFADYILEDSYRIAFTSKKIDTSISRLGNYLEHFYHLSKSDKRFSKDFEIAWTNRNLLVLICITNHFNSVIKKIESYKKKETKTRNLNELQIKLEQIKEVFNLTDWDDLIEQTKSMSTS